LRELAVEPVTIFIKGLLGSDLAARSELRYDPARGQLLIIDGQETAQPPMGASLITSWPNQSVAPPSWGGQVDLVALEREMADFSKHGTYFEGPPLTEPFVLDRARVLETAQSLLNDDSSEPELRRFAADPRFARLANDLTGGIEKTYRHLGAAPSAEQVGASLAETARAYLDQFSSMTAEEALEQAVTWVTVGGLCSYAVDKEGHAHLIAEMYQSFGQNKGGLRVLDDLLQQSKGPRLTSIQDAVEAEQQEAAGPSPEL
jgi:hypothetical protein